MMSVVLYGILMGHIYSYREQYTHIGITFAVTYMLKRLIRQTGNTDNADLIGLGGYALTINGFVRLLGDMKRAGFTGGKGDSGKIVGGIFGDQWSKDWSKIEGMIEQLQHLIGK